MIQTLALGGRNITCRISILLLIYWQNKKVYAPQIMESVIYGYLMLKSGKSRRVGQNAAFCSGGQHSPVTVFINPFGEIDHSLVHKYEIDRIKTCITSCFISCTVVLSPPTAEVNKR